MTGEVDKLIACINPDRYADFSLSKDRKEFMNLLKEDFSEALKKVKPKPSQEYKLIYDSYQESLEPVYFWILDFVQGIYSDVEKLTDSFTSSPGSLQSSELGMKATRMQEEGMKIMQTIGVLIKSLVNIIYDLKEFEIRLKHYEAYHSSNKEEKQAGLLALKQIWLDNVDIKRGNTSIKGLAMSQAGFVTLIDAFMIANSPDDIDNKDFDLNDRVKRLLKPRVYEFYKWLDYSEKELKKRKEIEKSWLKSQVNSLKLYARWAKPYFKLATELQQKDQNIPGIVKAFNTTVLELELLAKKSVDVDDLVYNHKLPDFFIKTRNKLKRKYYSVLTLDFFYRGIPQRVTSQGNYVQAGRVEVTFRAYCLNQDEYDVLKKRLDDSDMSLALKMVEDAVTEPLKELQEDIEYFLKSDKEKEKEVKAKSQAEDINPFSALFSIFKRKDKIKTSEEKAKKSEKIKSMLEKGIPKDSYAESLVRKEAESSAKDFCYTVYDVYKKAHGMASLGDLADTQG